MEISRWCQPPVFGARYDKPQQGRRNGISAISAAPPGLALLQETGGLHHRLRSDVPPGQTVADRTQNSWHALTRQTNALVLLIKGYSKLAEDFRADIRDVGESREGNRRVREFVAA